MLETAIALPVLVFFMMAIMELCLIANARQLANYAAFSAARTASVYGLDSTGRAKTHLAAAMAMTSISPRTPQNPINILTAYGVQDPGSVVRALLNIPGMPGDTATWLARLAEAYVRTSAPTCDTGTTTGKTRRHVAVDLTYIYRCTILPYGGFWGNAGLTAYITYLRGLPAPIPGLIEPVVEHMESNWRWNIPIRGRAVIDYWRR